MNKFAVDDRVQVSSDFFWARGATATISEFPWGQEGLTHQETSALGVHTVYWVWFDVPQLDADGDGPYRAGQIWEESLTLISS